MDIRLITYLAATAYLLSGLGIGLRLFMADRPPVPRMPTLLVGCIAVILHTVVLYHALDTPYGVNLDFFNAGSLIAWMISVLLLISSLSKPVENLAIFMFPMAAVTMLFDMYFPGEFLLSNDASWALRLHVITSILAYSLLTLGSVQALLLAIQERHLKRHHPGGFVGSLPPLQTMESLLFEMITLGFVLLTVSLMTGFIYLQDMFEPHVAHKSVLAIIAWIVFGTLLWGRYRYGWRGPTAIRWTLIGFVSLMLGYFGSKALLKFILHR